MYLLAVCHLFDDVMQTPINTINVFPSCYVLISTFTSITLHLNASGTES